MRSKVFGPLGMTHSTFDFPTALSGNFASPHDNDVDGKTIPARMDSNYSVVPLRPAGGMWTSASDLSNYVRMELALGNAEALPFRDATFGEVHAAHAEVRRFGDAPLDLRHGAHLSAESHFADENCIVRNGNVVDARRERRRDGQVAARLAQLDTADDVQENVELRERKAHPLVEHRK